MARCGAYKVSQDGSRYYSISGERCSCNAIWTAYYSKNLGIYLFEDSVRTPANNRGLDLHGYSNREILVDADGVRHYYENHKDLVKLRLCYYHLHMLMGYMQPSLCGWFFPKEYFDAAAACREEPTRNLRKFGKYGQVITLGGRNAKTDSTALVVAAERTSAQKLYHCCDMLNDSNRNSDQAMMDSLMKL